MHDGVTGELNVRALIIARIARVPQTASSLLYMIDLPQHKYTHRS